MNAVRPLRTIVKALFLPIACLACLAWVGIFVVIYIRLPTHNVGMTTLLVFAGVLLVFPWMSLVMGIMRRMLADDRAPKNHDSKS